MAIELHHTRRGPRIAASPATISHERRKVVHRRAIAAGDLPPPLTAR